MNVKDEVNNGLVACFNKFQTDGIYSIYLYGSITGPDFNPETSDIDSIAIVSEDVPQEFEKVLQNFLKNEYKHIRKFGIRILYTSELISLDKKSVLTSFIPPQALLLDFPYWEHVCGKQFLSSDFTSVTYKDGLKAMQGVIETWHWQSVENVTADKIVNYLKVIARIIWTHDGVQGDHYPFSYTELANKMNGFEDIANLILNLKKDNWSEAKFISHKQDFQRFIEGVPALIS